MKLASFRIMRPSTVPIKHSSEMARFAITLYVWSLLFGFAGVGLDFYLKGLGQEFLPMLNLILGVVSVLLSIWGVYVHAMGKSLSAAHSLLGLLGPLGWLIVTALPGPIQEQSRQSRGIR